MLPSTMTWAEDRAPVGTDPSADPGVVSEDRAVALLPPTSLAYNTNAQNPNTTKQLQHSNDPNPLTDVSISR
jgi:hypothetical protein